MRLARGEGLLDVVRASTAKDDDIKQGVRAETVGTVHTTCDLTRSEETRDRLAVLTNDAGLVVDFKTTHGVVKNGGHDGDVEVVVELPLRVGEELLPERVFLRARGGVVVVEGLLEDLGGEAHVFRERLAGLVALHEAAADVVLAVPFDLFRRSAVEDKADGELWGA